MTAKGILIASIFLLSMSSVSCAAGYYYGEARYPLVFGGTYYYYSPDRFYDYDYLYRRRYPRRWYYARPYRFFSHPRTYRYYTPFRYRYFDRDRRYQRFHGRSGWEQRRFHDRFRNERRGRSFDRHERFHRRLERRHERFHRRVR